MSKVDQLLREFILLEVDFHFATNSISIIFSSNSTNEILYRIWIDPFWRFVKNDNLIMSSMSCPWHENFETESDYKNAFGLWCDSVNYLKPLKVCKFNCESPLNDLTIHWEDKTVLQVFQTSDTEETWYIEDIKNNKFYLALSGKLIEEEK